MKNVNFKKIAQVIMIGGYIFAAGATAGAFSWNQLTKHQNQVTEKAIQAALKAVPVAQASNPK